MRTHWMVGLVVLVGGGCNLDLGSLTFVGNADVTVTADGSGHTSVTACMPASLFACVRTPLGDTLAARTTGAAVFLEFSAETLFGEPDTTNPAEGAYSASLADGPTLTLSWLVGTAGQSQSITMPAAFNILPPPQTTYARDSVVILSVDDDGANIVWTVDVDCGGIYKVGSGKELEVSVSSFTQPGDCTATFIATRANPPLTVETNEGENMTVSVAQVRQVGPLQFPGQ